MIAAPRARRLALAAASLLVAPPLALLVASLFLALPAPLEGDALRSRSSVRLLDREGQLFAEVRADDGARATWASLEELGEPLRAAMIAAEDRRFFAHPGVDPLAFTRALGQAVWHRRVVSGASTLTQQLARLLAPHPRTALGKLGEMALALRIERGVSKARILEAYLNLAPFGPGVRGAPAACRRWLDKPCRDLSLAEAAALAALPRGPTLYDPRKGTTRILLRRDRILARMRAAGTARADDVARALAEPLRIQPDPAAHGAPHFARALVAGQLEPRARGVAEIETTLDAALQREVETAARAQLRALSDRHATAASVVVVENATGEVLAYLGSPDIDDVARLGANDGLRAARQPGSTLKPFLYELAMERLGFTAATVLPDVELHLGEAGGVFVPSNYDGRYHGPVRLRDALANSYNVPAVWTASRIGPDRLLDRLRELGFELSADAAHYGSALALGDGEVTLLALARAYATLARRGDDRPLRFVRALSGVPVPLEPARRVLDPTAAYLVGDVLRDRRARISSFGDGSALELPFPAAVKTGTSKGYRDNLAVGFTDAVTVAVWVGNFDGSAMQGVSGVTGAAPLLREVLVAAMRGRDAVALSPPPPGSLDVEEVEICPLSGARPTAACAHTKRELFARGTAPTVTCAMHEEVRTDARDGLRAGPSCSTDVATRTFERYEGAYLAWARAAGRPLAPEGFSARCPASPGAAERGSLDAPRVDAPRDGARYLVDPGLALEQAIVLRARARPGARVTFSLDGARLGTVSAPFELPWRLAPGAHRLVVDDGVRASDAVAFDVE